MRQLRSDLAPWGGAALVVLLMSGIAWAWGEKASTGGSVISTSSGFKAGAGGVSTPGYCFVDDGSNDCFYRSAADELSVSTNGVQRWAVEADGDLVCKATTGTAKLLSSTNAATASTTVGAWTLDTAALDANDLVLDIQTGAASVAKIDKEGDLTCAQGVFTGNIDARGNVADSTGNLTIADAVDVSGAVSSSVAASSDALILTAGAQICIDGPTCAHRFYYDTGTPRFRFNNHGYFQGNVTADGTFSSTVASGSNAFACTTVGCRLHLGSATRYLYDDTAGIAATGGPFTVYHDILTSTGLFRMANNGVTGELRGSAADGASAIAFKFNNQNTLSTAGAKLVSYQNNGVEKASIDKDGVLTAPSATFSASMTLTPTASAPASPVSGMMYMDSTPTPDELCVYDGAGWQALITGTDANCT